MTNHTLNKQLVRSMQLKCPLLESVDVFLFPDGLIKERKINESFLSGRYPEIQTMAMENMNNERSIVDGVRNRHISETNDAGTETNTLLDVFKFVDNNNYPQLWQTLLKSMALFPTTVSCEQSFSRLRHKHHENMNHETVFSFLSTSRKNKRFIFET